MTLDQLRTYKRILLLGYGVEGKATHEYVKKFHPTAEISIADQKDDPDYLNKQTGFDLCIKTPGIPKEKIHIPYTTATNIFFGNITNKTIGITGTKGKSTTSQLLHTFLQHENVPSKLAGNIGTPMLDLLIHDKLQPDDLVILELSSYQLDDLEYSPHISVVLNIEEAHLDYHGSFDAYKQAKLHIAAHAEETDYYVYNPEDIDTINAQTKAQKVAFREVHISLPGLHRDTINAVYTIAQILHLNATKLQLVIQSFKHLPHRLENVGIFEGIQFIDDSASTTPSATIFALTSLQNVDTLICGGLSRNHSFSALSKAIVASQLRNLVIFPDIQEGLTQALGEHALQLNILHTDSMEEAVNFAFLNTGAGNVCLLSPGFASYQMYSGFPERGNDFQSHIKNYAQKKSEA